MELKQRKWQRVKNGKKLLIVPYGIETWITCAVANVDALLIVPYGIETVIHKSSD